MGKGKKIKSSSGDPVTIGSLGDAIENQQKVHTYGKARQSGRQKQKFEEKSDDFEDEVSKSFLYFLRFRPLKMIRLHVKYDFSLLAEA